MNKLSLVHEIKKINGEIFRTINNRYKSMNIDITPMHAKVVITIYKSDVPLCQKDLEGPMSCNKSTLSFIISTMEKNGLLSRKVSDTDSRINYLVLTQKGLEMVEFLEEDRKYTEGVLTDGITDQEYATFMRVVDKIRNNMGRI